MKKLDKLQNISEKLLTDQDLRTLKGGVAVKDPCTCSCTCGYVVSEKCDCETACQICTWL
ncbi:MAG: TIGR04149 family rSAM-modified RiPP [Methanosarcina sp.]